MMVRSNSSWRSARISASLESPVAKTHPISSEDKPCKRSNEGHEATTIPISWEARNPRNDGADEFTTPSRRLLSVDNSSPESLAAGFQLMVGDQPTKRKIGIPAATEVNPEARRAAVDTVASAFSPELGR